KTPRPDIFQTLPPPFPFPAASIPPPTSPPPSSSHTGPRKSRRSARQRPQAPRSLPGRSPTDPPAAKYKQFHERRLSAPLSAVHPYGYRPRQLKNLSYQEIHQTGSC